MGYERFGGKLRESREAAGLTLPEVGEALGVKGQTVGTWERGRLKKPLSPGEVDNLVRLFRSKDVNVSVLDTRLPEVRRRDLLRCRREAPPQGAVLSRLQELRVVQ